MFDTLVENLFSGVEALFFFSLVIGFVAFIHELGHFVAAKMCDVRVDAFAIGMGRKLISSVRGETEYSLRLLPIGGFVLLAQEDGPSDGSEDAGDRAFSAKPLWQRVFILLAGPFMNAVGTLLLLTVSLAWFGQPESTLMVTHVVADSPAQEAGLKAGDRFLSINGKTIERFEEGRMWIASSASKPLDMQLVRGQDFQSITPEAMLATLKTLEGDFVFKAQKEGESSHWVLSTVEGVRQFLEGGVTGYDLELARDLRQLDVQLTPSSGGRIGVGIRPFSLSEKLIRLPFGDAFIEAQRTTILLTRQLFEQLGSMFSGLVRRFSPPEDIGGPIAIASTVARHAEHGVNSLLLLTAQISLCIGIFNLIPIPGLDGGRILVLSVKDGVNAFGRRVLKRTEDTFNDIAEGYVNIAGVLCVFSLMILVTIKDIRDLLP